MNFDTECSIWRQNMICKFPACSVCECDESEIPLPWKQMSFNDKIYKEIDKKLDSLLEKFDYTQNQWLVENEVDEQKGVFVNLEKNPEAFTGYQGQYIWSAIYKENCFSGIIDKMCVEEKVFFKIISAIHSNINLHVCKTFVDIYKNKTFSNIELMKQIFLNHKDRINNLFFLYSLLMEAFYKAEKFIRKYNVTTGYEADDLNAIKIINHLYEENNELRHFYEEGYDQSESLRKFMRFERLNEIKMRFRNISDIINCVSCQKCRMHGKLQINGVAAMFKILFSDEKKLTLKRNELVAFVNMIGKVSSSIKYVTDYLEETKKEKLQIKNIFFFLIIGTLILSILFFIFLIKNNRERFK